MNELLFVYGTLLPELAPAAVRAVVEKLVMIGAGSMSGRLYDLGAYPGAIFDASAATRVRGIMFALPKDEQFLRALDNYEGYQPDTSARSLFVRERKPVLLEDGRNLSCWVFLCPREPVGHGLILSGDYLAWRNGACTKGGD